MKCLIIYFLKILNVQLSKAHSLIVFNEHVFPHIELRIDQYTQHLIIISALFSFSDFLIPKHSSGILNDLISPNYLVSSKVFKMQHSKTRYEYPY